MFLLPVHALTKLLHVFQGLLLPQAFGQQSNAAFGSSGFGVRRA